MDDVSRRALLTGAAASAVVAAPAKAEDIETARLRDALERIALLDEVDGHELTVKQAFEAVAIATNTLGKHPSQIAAERDARHR
jgi:hypothetical protein